MSQQLIEIEVFDNSVELKFNDFADSFARKEKSIRIDGTISLDLYPNDDITVSLSNDDTIDIQNGQSVAFKNPATQQGFTSNQALYDFLKVVIR